MISNAFPNGILTSSSFSISRENEFPAHSSKLQKKEETGTAKQGVNWNLMPINLIVDQILGKLLPQHLVIFEASCKTHTTLADLAWKNRRQEHYYEFDWKACEGMQRKNKANYFLSHAVFHHFTMIQRPPFNKQFQNLQPEEVKQIYAHMVKFLSLSKQFPFLKCYLYRTLGSKLSHTGRQTAAMTEQRVAIDAEAFKGEYGGEILLHAFFELYTYQERLQPPARPNNLNLIMPYLKSAVAKKATCASWFAYQLLPNAASTFQLAIEAAKQKDFRALLAIVENADQQKLEELYQAGHKFGPILAKLAYLKYRAKEFIEAERLFEGAIKDFAHRITANVLAQAAMNKIGLKKNQEAEKLYEQALDACGNQIPAIIFANAAFNKHKLKKYRESELLYKQALEAYGNQAPAMVLAFAALNKMRLQKYQEAEPLYKQALDAYGNQAPKPVLVNAALNKSKLDKQKIDSSQTKQYSQ